MKSTEQMANQLLARIYKDIHQVTLSTNYELEFGGSFVDERTKEIICSIGEYNISDIKNFLLM